ncbi:hypothetical protein [Neolewinella persica]|uniref:hypothetical protein n=1 Tax=Neolewinella persica TaxID=70998 RepID=UPI0003A6A39A|nr:hypothetical protein [Neolewinella persica]
MKKIVAEIFQAKLKETTLAISEIKGYGTVNSVFDVACRDESYVIRLNKEEGKGLEFIKEEWCNN